MIEGKICGGSSGRIVKRSWCGIARLFVQTVLPIVGEGGSPSGVALAFEMVGFGGKWSGRIRFDQGEKGFEWRYQDGHVEFGTKPALRKFRRGTPGFGKIGGELLLEFGENQIEGKNFGCEGMARGEDLGAADTRGIINIADGKEGHLRSREPSSRERISEEPTISRYQPG